VLEIRHAKEIAGSYELPPNPDFFLIVICCVLAFRKKVAVTPMSDTPLISSYKNLFTEHLTIHQQGTVCEITPHPEETSSILVPYINLPYHDFIVFLLLGLGKTVLFKDLPEKRLSVWKKQITHFGFNIESHHTEDTISLFLAADGVFSIPEDILDINLVHQCLGLAFGLRKKCTFTIDHPFQSPLRHLLPCFGYEMNIKSNYEKKEKTQLEKRLRFLSPKLLKKSDSKMSFAVSIDFTNSQADEVTITLPGDDILASTLLTAKSLIQKGQLVLGNVPLEPWSCAMINYIRKMGCNPAIQEKRQTSFGSTGVVSLQKFKCIGHKMECKPLYHYRRQLPAMVALATFAKGQSLFRALEDLRNDAPDPIEQLLACIRLMGGRHGELIDGIVIDGAKQYDGFDLPDSFSAALNSALAAAGLKCNGTTTINDTAIIQRWPDFREVINTLCIFRT